MLPPIQTPYHVEFMALVNWSLAPLVFLVVTAALWLLVTFLLIRRAWPSKAAPRYKRSAAM